VSQDLETLQVLAGHNCQLDVAVDYERCINQAIIDPARQGGTRQAGAYCHCDIVNGNGVIELALTAVRQDNGNGHGACSSVASTNGHPVKYLDIDSMVPHRAGDARK
jgi:hypothetical protein